jgi:hypothetical protein
MRGWASALRVDAVGLKQLVGIGHVGHARQQEGHQGRTFGTCHGTKQRHEAFAIGAPVVGRHGNACHQHTRAGGLGQAGHFGQVGLGHAQRKAAQGVIATQGQHHHLRLVLGQQHRQAGAPTRGGVAADAGVDHLPGPLFLGQALLQQGHPAGATRQAVFGRQAVTHHQQGAACPLRTHGRAAAAQSGTPASRLKWRQNARRGRSEESMSEPIIEVQHVTKQVADATGTLTILHEIDFELRAHESVAIVGASGSGKSTLLSIIAGLDVPTSGTVKLAGVDLFSLDEDQRAEARSNKVGFVFQSFQLLGNLTTRWKT